MAATLVRILGKLVQALQTGMARVLGLGKKLAWRASELAVKWGNESAFSWRFDPGYCKALGFRLLS
jgi:hypothetical protein